MPTNPSYNDRVRAMVQACQAVENTPHLLAQYEFRGGAKADLDFIIAHGVAAANAKSATLSASGDAKVATAAKTRAFMALLEEDSILKKAIRAVVELDIALKKVGPEAAAIRLQRILDNDTEVTITDFTAEGQKQRKVKKKYSDEARRQEIEKDAKALLDFIDEAASPSGASLANVVKALENRKVTRARVEALHADARALAGMLKEAELKRGGLMAAHSSTRENVSNVLKAFGAIRGILRSVARTSPDLANVLAKTGARG